MAYIEDIDITVTNATSGLQQAAFNIPLIMGTHASTAEAYTEYANMAAVAVDYADTDVEYDMAASLFGQTPTLEKIAIMRKLDATSISTALSTLILTNNAWYVLLITSKVKADLQEAGTWANANERLFIGSTSDLTALTGRNLDREAYYLTTHLTDYVDSAVVGKCLGYTPGTASWKWKALSGIQDSGFSLTDLNTIRTNQGNSVSDIGGKIITNDGWTTSGESIKTIILIDYCKSRIKTALYRLFITNPQIPMDVSGIAQVEGTISAELAALATAGAIAQVDTTSESDMAFSEDGKYLYRVTAPTRAQIPVNDRANGILSGVIAEFYTSGEIREVKLNLNVLI